MVDEMSYFPTPTQPQGTTTTQPQGTTTTVRLRGLTFGLFLLIVTCSGWLLVITSLISGRSSSFWVILDGC